MKKKRLGRPDLTAYFFVSETPNHVSGLMFVANDKELIMEQKKNFDSARAEIIKQGISTVSIELFKADRLTDLIFEA